MTSPDNPAGRLHSLIKAAVASSPNHTMIRVWANVFETDPNDQIAVIKRLANVYALIDETRRFLALNANLNHEIYLAGFSSIEQGVSPVHLNAPLSNVMPYFSPDVLARLEFCSEALRSFHIEEAASEEELASLKAIVDTLYESLLNSGIEEALRIQLIEEVTRIQTALSIYKIRGVKGVKDALQSLIGCVLVNHDPIKENLTKDPSIFKKVGDLIEQLDAFSGKAKKLHTLLSKATRILAPLYTGGSSTSGIQGSSGVVEAGDNEMNI